MSQVVAWNYVFALMLCELFFGPNLDNITWTSPWGIYISLAILMPSIFLFLAASIKHMGIVKTDAAQRLSLFIPILASWFIFGEEFSILKIIGLAIGFPAILLIFSRKDNNQVNKWQYPVIVLIGFGIVDVLFKQIALMTSLPFTTSLFIVFIGALIVATAIAIYDAVKKKKGFAIMNLAFGMLVGIFNFGNILFYLKAHKAFSENPSTVFAIMNIGVIVAGSLAGILIFKEKMTKLNYAGLLMAISAIIFITLSQVYSS
jgi:drug/metabolite transporter (DMT)-like permease